MKVSRYICASKTHKMRRTILLTIAALIISFCAKAQVPAYVPSQGLLAWYSFSGNSQDLSGNGNNLTNNGATLAADRYGNSNSAYQFNGTSGYLVNNTPSYIMYDTSSFTLSVWVYRPSATYGVYIMHGSTVGGNFNYNIQGSATGITNFERISRAQPGYGVRHRILQEYGSILLAPMRIRS